MVRRRVEIKAIDDKAKRHTTFTKRRQGLIKKTHDFCTKSDSQAAVIVFSAAGNFFGFGHPSLNMLVNRYIAHPSSAFAREADEVDGVRVHGGGASSGGGDGGGVEDRTVALPMTETEKRIVEALERRRWDGAVRDLGLQELDELAAEMERIKGMVAARRNDLKRKSAAEGGFSGESSR